MIENSDEKDYEEISNKGFDDVHQKFIKYNWILTRNKKTEIVYENRKTQDEFMIRILEKTIDILVPLRNTNVLYKTTFKDYFTASEYLIMHLENYENPSDM